jgi:DNA-binding IclR family transcriptional regulator
MPAADRNGSLGVIGKATSLLDQLAGNGDMSAAGLSERLGEPRTTVYRLIRALEQAEFVEPADQAGRYRLGLKLFRLGGVVVARSTSGQGRAAAHGGVARYHRRDGVPVHPPRH